MQPKEQVRKIIVLTQYHFNERDFKRYGISLLRKNGFEVEVWDITRLVACGIAREDKVLDEFYQVIDDKKQFFEKLSTLDKTSLVYCIPGFARRNLFIFKIFTKMKIRYFMAYASAHPVSHLTKSEVYSLQGNILKRISTKLRNLTISSILDLIFQFIPQKLLSLQPPEFIITGGKIDRLIIPEWIKLKQYSIFQIHAFDYDIYLTNSVNNETSITSQNPMAVYLDEYFPFHPNFIYSSSVNTTTPEGYYPSLCKFFSNIEKARQIPVFIAAHPRSEYEKLPDYFQGRSIIRGKTFDLVNNSDFVIAHTSTSVNFAVMLKKPVIFITTNELNRSIWGIATKKMANLLGKQVYNIDEEYQIDWEKEMVVNQDAYDDYRNTFIKEDGSDDVGLFWQIVADRLKVR